MPLLLLIEKSASSWYIAPPISSTAVSIASVSTLIVSKTVSIASNTALSVADKATFNSQLESI